MKIEKDTTPRTEGQNDIAHACARAMTSTPNTVIHEKARKILQQVTHVNPLNDDAFFRIRMRAHHLHEAAMRAAKPLDAET